MSELELSVGLAHKLEKAFGRNDWTLADVDKLCQGDTLAQHRKVLLGTAVIQDLPPAKPVGEPKNEPTVIELVTYAGYFAAVWLLWRSGIAGRVTPRVAEPRTA